MTAAAIFEHQAADIHIGGFVEDAIATCSAASGASASAYNPCGNVLFRVHAVYQETVSGINRVNTPKVGNNQVAINACILLDHFHKFFILLKVDINTFLDVGEGKDLLRGHGAACVD